MLGGRVVGLLVGVDGVVFFIKVKCASHCMGFFVGRFRGMAITVVVAYGGLC